MPSLRTRTQIAIATFGLTLVTGCSSPARDRTGRDTTAVVSPAFDSTTVFPADRSQVRPEDGVALADGRLLVADQVNGLRLVEVDGRSKPFGEMVAKGYRHQPPEHSGAANGVSLEPDGAHVLVADVFGGAIYRVDVSSGATEKLYQHRYGINTAVRDSRGNVWFTQSTANSPAEAEAHLLASLDRPDREGALLRLASKNGRLAAEAQVVVDSLGFANGVVIDEPHGQLYVSETNGRRVLRYRVDLSRGTLSERTVVVDSVDADNLELDGEDLWIAVPLSNTVLVVNTATGARRTFYHSQTPAQQQVVAEFTRRGQTGEPRLQLITPAISEPLPAMITGVILGPAGGPVYLTGLGNALLKLPR